MRVRRGAGAGDLERDRVERQVIGARLGRVLPQVLTRQVRTLGRRLVVVLGLGIQPPAPSWGNMLSNAQEMVFSAPLAAVWPGLAILLSVTGCTLVADGVRQRMP